MSFIEYPILHTLGVILITDLLPTGLPQVYSIPQYYYILILLLTGQYHKRSDLNSASSSKISK